MRSEKLEKYVLAAMFAALCFAGTFFFKIPMLHGYIHLGDCMVLLAGILLGPVYGGLAAGIGSMLADVIAGYASYAPGTFAIKLLAAMAAAAIFRLFYKQIKSNVSRIVITSISGLAGGIIVVLGYLVYEAFVLRFGAGAIAAIPENIVQATSGVIISTMLYPVLFRIPSVKQLVNS